MNSKYQQTTGTKTRTGSGKGKGKRPQDKNPLFVVTNKGKDVEMAKNFYEALIKKLGLEPLIEALGNLVKFILENFKGIMGLKILESWLNDFIGDLKANFHLGKFVGDHILSQFGIKKKTKTQEAF